MIRCSLFLAVAAALIAPHPITAQTGTGKPKDAAKTRGVEPTPGKSGTRTPPPGAAGATRFGNYHALLIGISYQDEITVSDGSVPLTFGRLATPLNDVRGLATSLSTNYGFGSNVRTLRDAEATRTRILDELRRYDRLGDDDNLLIFFAGHGELDRRESYWVTSGAKTVSDCLKRTEILDALKTINARHVLLIVDSCYAGGLLKRDGRQTSSEAIPEKYIEQVAKEHSYQIMTAGGLSPVEDRDHSGNHSLFAGYLLRRLQDNQSKFLSATQLFGRFVAVIPQRSQQLQSQVPRLGRFPHPRADLGEFVFERVNNAPASYEAVPASIQFGLPHGYQLPRDVRAEWKGTEVTFRSTSDNCEMILIDAGSFHYGPDRDTHTVRDPFLIDKYEVTVERFQAFMESKPPVSDLPFWQKPGFEAPTQPVVGVTLEDALAFARWAGKQLPSEFQWEYAAAWDPKNHQRCEHPWGDTFDPTIKPTHLPPPVAASGIDVSKWGCRGMGSGVMEWCLLGEYDPLRWRFGVVRGNSQVGNSGRNLTFLRRKTGDRLLFERSRADVKIGFRCVTYLVPY